MIRHHKMDVILHALTLPYIPVAESQRSIIAVSWYSRVEPSSDGLKNPAFGEKKPAFGKKMPACGDNQTNLQGEKAYQTIIFPISFL